jgi:hypothetical protein
MPKSGFKYGKGNLPRKGGKPQGLTNKNARRLLDEAMRPSGATSGRRSKPRLVKSGGKPSTGSK